MPDVRRAHAPRDPRSYRGDSRHTPDRQAGSSGVDLPGVRLLRGSRRRNVLAGAERLQHVAAHIVAERVNRQLGLALVAEDFVDGGTPFLGHIQARFGHPDDVHLEGLHQKVFSIPAVRTRKRHTAILLESPAGNATNCVRSAVRVYSSSSSNSKTSPRRRIWPCEWPARMQCGPLASTDTTATSQGRAR